MKRWTKWIAPVASLALVLSLGIANSRADDATATTPTGKAKVTVTVVDAAGKPVAGATVGIMVAPPAGKKNKAPASTQPDGAAKAKPTPLESGVTGADGTFELTKIQDGDFVVAARLKGTGAGREKVTVADDKDQTITVTLKAPKAKN